MFKRTFAALASAALLAGMGAAPAAAQQQQQTPTLENYLSCAAIFFVLAQGIDEPETKQLAEFAMVESFNRAEPLGAARNQNIDQLIEVAAAEATQLQASVDAATSDDARGQVFLTWGPGLERCLAIIE